MRYQTFLKAAAWISVMQITGSVAFAAVSFTKVAAGAIGADALHCQNLAWGDYDGDGNVDLFVGFNTFLTDSEPHRLYHNNGDGTFTRVLDGGIADDMDTSNAMGAAWADFENDGDLDLFIAQNENLGAVSIDRLYLNNGDGTFIRAGQDWITDDFSVDAAWVDVDSDGLLDLVVTGYYSVSLFHHRSDGFMERSLIADIPDKYFSTMNWADYDHDNDLDLFISGGAIIYQNDGNGGFTADPLNASNVNAPVLGDFDNDGDPDMAKGVFRGDRLEFFQNNGDRTWTLLEGLIAAPGEVGFRPGSWADYDNDGYLDLFIPTSSNPDVTYDPWGPLVYPNMLLHNEGDGTFTRVTEGPLVTEMGMSFAAAWADYDNDGDLDVVLSDGQNLSNKAEQLPAVPVALYRNDGGNDNNWLNLTLVGTESNRSAIGAKVFATATINGVAMTQMREVGNGQGGYSQCDTRVHFGLGNATVVDELRIEWPSGAVQILTDVVANNFIEIEEWYLSWAGIPCVVTDGPCNYVYVGNPIGWLAIGPNGWVYCYNLRCWLCVPEEFVEIFGMWLFVPRL